MYLQCTTTCSLCVRTWNSAKKKIILSLGRTGIRSTVLEVMKALGGEHKVGKAPVGGLEAEIQAWLDAREWGWGNDWDL